MSLIAPLAYLTADLPGIGGVIRQRPEDFVVHEQPLYEPSGAGEHLMLYVEKRSATTSDMVRRLAKLFRVRRSDVGYAGLKDKHAVTRQHLSVWLPKRDNDEQLLARFEHTPYKLIWARRHFNKLRRGHHAGNRFQIKVRQVGRDAVDRARHILDVLTRLGAPNYLGEQRFGYRLNNHLVGVHLLRGEHQAALDFMLGRPDATDGPRMRACREAYERGDFAGALELWPRHLRYDRQVLDALRRGRTAEQAIRAMDRMQIDFLIASVQGAAFNAVVDRRVRMGLLGTLVPGDLAWKHDNRSVFAVDEATAEKENAPDGRVPRLEVSPSGPMWGRDMLQPAGEPLRWEQQALADLGVTFDDLTRPPFRISGERRAARMVVRHPQVDFGTDEHGDYLQVGFELGRGSFATVVMREIMKCSSAAQSNGADSDTEDDSLHEEES